MKSISSKNLVYLIPTVPIVIWWVYYSIILSPPFYDTFDPETAYFLDSLSVFNGQAYHYVDHPGTPLSVIGSILLALTYPFTSGDSFILYQLAHPQVFFQLTHIFLMISFSVSAAYFFKTASRLLDKRLWLLGLALPLLYFTIPQYSFASITLWSHNSFGFPFGTLLSITFVSVIAQQNGIKPQTIFVLGLLNGIFATSQVYFLAWVISLVSGFFLFFLLTKHSLWQAIRAALLSVVASAIGYLIGILPALKRWDYFLGWIQDLISHQGRYGLGTEGFLSRDMVVVGMRYMLETSTPLMVLSAISIITFLFLVAAKNSRADAGLLSSGAALTLQLLLLTFMIIKQTRSIYMLSMAATMPVLALVDVKLLENFIFPNSHLPKLAGMVVIILAISVWAQTALGLRESISKKRVQIATELKQSENIQKFVMRYANRKGKSQKELIVLYTFPVRNECAALLDKQIETQLAVYEEMEQVCPNQYALYFSPSDKLSELNSKVFVKGEWKNLKDFEWDIIFTQGYYAIGLFPDWLEESVKINELRHGLSAITPK